MKLEDYAALGGMLEPEVMHANKMNQVNSSKKEDSNKVFSSLEATSIKSYCNLISKSLVAAASNAILPINNLVEQETPVPCLYECLYIRSRKGTYICLLFNMHLLWGSAGYGHMVTVKT